MFFSKTFGKNASATFISSQLSSWEIPRQTGTSNRGLKPMFSENHEIWQPG